MSNSSVSDISSVLNSMRTSGANKTKGSNAGSSSLDMDGFLTLMVAQFQNQDPENAASTSDMLNQMMTMTVIQAVQDITDATTLQYAGSLVGKEVTTAYFDEKGNLVEEVGTVTGTGTYGGKQVIFVNDKMYYLSDIMAVGRLPEEKTETDPTTDGDGEGDGTGDATGGE